MEKGLLHIEANIESIDKVKELLDELKALSDKYETTIDLRIGLGPQEYYTLT